MSYITNSVTIIITLSTFWECASTQDSYYIKQYTRNILLKQGVLQGIVVEPRVNRALPPIEQYLGLPYAAPPVGELRFMPSGSAPSWFGIRYADSFGPVCPQKFPDEKVMSQERKEYFSRLKEYLQNQSEDCLYLNIYAPFQESERSSRKYPVMVFIHGESFEWNSGNPYDGSVLAAYGKVIVVTLNFRLGILGFLKAGTEEHSRSNFGLVDQIAALLWVKENIAAFGGDPSAVTLFGQGTGAVCASLLMLSPIVQQEGNRMLFQRAILMGGTALADWALAGNARDVTYQVAQALNCQIQDDFAACLRRKRLDDIMAASAKTPNYTTRFGPIVDSLVVPNDPKKSMTQYSDIFRRFELMYGVTELESVDLLDPVALTHGMLEKERDQELRNYLRTRCEMKPELCLARTLAEYTSESSQMALNDEKYDGRASAASSGHEPPDRASLARNALLDILSDARSVAPIVQTARYHAALNLQSYFYVFTHKTISKEYIRGKSFNGEELPYVFGVPLDGPKFHFIDQYTKQERLFSEIIMTYFCNFAYTGNPNVPRKNEYFTLSPVDWIRFDVEWPEFDIKQERYLELGAPPKLSSHYRSKEVIFWNDIFPQLTDNRTFLPPPTKKPVNNRFPPKHSRPWILDHIPGGAPAVIQKYENFNRPYETPKDTFGVLKLSGKERPDNMMNNNQYGTVVTSPSEEVRHASTVNVLIVIGSLFLLANLLLFLVLYYKCYRIKKNSHVSGKVDEQIEVTEDEKQPNNLHDDPFMLNGCNIVKMISKSSSKTEETYEAVKSDSKGKCKLTRQVSSSTIDAHTKVRDWITNEIVHRYSPRFFRARPHGNAGKKQVPQRNSCVPLEVEQNSTLGRSPTRPVSPTTIHPHLGEFPTFVGKPGKVSVAIDATPTGRGNSVLMQQPIELTKSLDCPSFTPDLELNSLRRSITLEDFSPRVVDSKKDLRKSTTSINLKYAQEPTVIKIEHGHSKSEPVQDFYSSKRKMKTFDPNSDINVTCIDEIQKHIPLSPEESLMTIKRRNFPKVLPDHPGREALLHKRMSMPAHNLFMPIPEISSFSQPNSPNNKSLGKLPPAPPPRTSSTLGRQNSSSSGVLPVCLSEPQLAEEPPSSPEPEIACNNLYVGPLIPKLHKTDDGKLNTQPIYESLRNVRRQNSSDGKGEKPAKAIVTANPNQPIKRVDPKIIVKPTISRKISDPASNGKNITRVCVPDNQPLLATPNNKVEAQNKSLQKVESVEKDGVSAKVIRPKKSQIPTLVKNSNTSLNKESSSSESTPSEESDTGTVVKRSVY